MQDGTYTHLVTMPATNSHNAVSCKTAWCSPAAAYYFRPGTGSGATRWLIRFQGGGWCTDTGSCQLRMDTAPWLMSSKLYPVRRSKTHIGNCR